MPVRFDKRFTTKARRKSAIKVQNQLIQAGKKNLVAPILVSLYADFLQCG
jgi:hypothetical protein